MNEQEKQEDKWKKIVELWEEGHNLSEEELKQWTNDPEALNACKELMRCKNAVARRFEEDAPRPEEEWKQFRSRQQSTTVTEKKTSEPTPKNHRFLWGAATGVAASFLIFFLYTWFSGESSNEKNYIVFHATDSLQQVTLQTSIGGHITLSKSTREEELLTVSPALYKTDSMELAYHNIPTNTPAIEEEVEMHVLSIPRGQNFKLVLADGSTVWMNAESRLIYPSRFTGDERMVQLNGEAYFQVSKDAEHPFIIQTERLKTKVLGTEINIRHYAADDTHVTLINGKVEVSRKSGEDAICLSPGEDASWTDHGALVVKKVEVDPYVYW